MMASNVPCHAEFETPYLSAELVIPRSTILESFTPRLKELMSSNDVPLQSECPSIVDATSKISERVAFLRDAIASLEKECNQLAAARERLESIPRVIRRIPPEIIQSIFVALLPSDKDAFIKDSLSLRQPMWTVSQVCRSWRDIALSTPDLWSHIGIRTRYPSGSINLGLLDTQLSRTRSLSLSISVHASIYPGFSRQVESALDLLGPHMHRAHALSLVIDDEFYDYLSKFEKSFPALRILHCDEINPPTSGNILSRLFKSVPQLSRLFVPQLLFLRSWENIDWSRVTTLMGPCGQPFVSESHDTLLYFLSKTYPRNLTSCWVDLDIDFSLNLEVPSVPLRFPHLKELVLQASEDLSDDMIEPVLNGLELPALETLKLLGAAVEVECLEAFIRRSTCTLRSLHLATHGQDASGVVRVLKLTPQLEELAIEFLAPVHRSRDYLTGLAKMLGLSPLGLFVPRLQRACLVYVMDSMDMYHDTQQIMSACPGLQVDAMAWNDYSAQNVPDDTVTFVETPGRIPKNFLS